MSIFVGRKRLIFPGLVTSSSFALQSNDKLQFSQHFISEFGSGFPISLDSPDKNFLLDQGCLI